MIRIIDGFFFTNEGGTYTLYECGVREKIDRKTRKPTGELTDFTDTIGYFNALQPMLEKCLSVASGKKAEISECNDLSEYIKIMRLTYDDIKKSIDFSTFRGDA